MEHYDLVVIGFGKAGKTLAGYMASQNKKVAVIEKDKKMYGGTCINVACIPTKALVYKAERASLIPNSYKARAAYYKEAIEAKDELTGMLRDKNYHKLADNPNIRIYDGVGSFETDHIIRITSESGTSQIEGDKILIDTGARPFLPPIEGLNASKRVFLSETLLNQKILPKKLVVIGGGYIGVEFASMFNLFGSEVTILQDSDIFLPREDQEIALAVLASLTKRGIKVIKNAKITRIVDYEKESGVFYSTPDGATHVKGDAILVAAGRRPNIEELNLSNAGVELTERKAIKTDSTLKTSKDNIYAAGDVVGGLQFTYISLDDFRIVKSALSGLNSRTNLNRGAVPYSVFITPCFSRVGLTEQEAVQKGYKILVGRLPASAIPKSHILRETDGLDKVIINEEDHTILGAHLFSAESYEVINIIKLAIDSKIPYEVLRDSIYTHPTMAEGLNDLFAAVK
jgi:pyruvate/2-oxoglutarate dehydrogenase complex dihydrolipoamide dehydrogenase (E3) component